MMIGSTLLPLLQNKQTLGRQQYLKQMGSRTISKEGKNQLDSDSDQVNQPEHYTGGTIECWDYLKDNMPREAYIGGLEWNIKKYLHRWRYKKNPLEDLKKAQVYLDKLIEEVENKDGK